MYHKFEVEKGTTSTAQKPSACVKKKQSFTERNIPLVMNAEIWPKEAKIESSLNKHD